MTVRKGEKDEQLWGYIDRTGWFVIKPQFIDAGVFRGGLARQLIKLFLIGIPTTSPGKHHEWGYIDRTGKYVWKYKD